MFLFICLLFALTPALSSVTDGSLHICGHGEFQCSDGACISLDQACDGHPHCFDSSDEEYCDRIGSNQLGELILHRHKRQTACRRNQWRCRDGTCIGLDGKCDGTVDCPDRSDETFPLCRNTPCQSNFFRCTYGACVDGTAPCNGVSDCADNSDELLPRCRNDTQLVRGKFRCDSGQLIPAAGQCDGVVDCGDGTDETVRACAGLACPGYAFQCAYGACVDHGSDCDGKAECADGSDESDELCNRQGSGTTSPTVPSTPVESGNCFFPPHPLNGQYSVVGAAGARPGQRFKVLSLSVTCAPGYRVKEDSSAICYDGAWAGDLPQCVQFCKLNPHESVTYRCVLSGNEEGTRPCNVSEPSGTIVRPECNKPNYYSPGVLPLMHCIDGSWDNIATCQPECGRVTPEGVELVTGGVVAKRGELPWHAGIYSKEERPYMQICGGSLVSTSVVISAAHCFWKGSAQPAERFAVALGKLYRDWDDANDKDAQKSDIKAIHIPVRFQGAFSNFQEDIAILRLSRSVVYKTYIRPVCLNFDYSFDNRQLNVGQLGTVAGWGLTSENGEASPTLQVIRMPFVDLNTCIAESPANFREYISSDKFCAGYRNGTTVCQGDSGGGLAFPDWQMGVQRYYLRGIVSVAPTNRDKCNTHAYVTFTQIQKHEHLIKQYLN